MEEFIPIMQLGYIKETFHPAALECEEIRNIQEITPFDVASLLVAAYECLSFDVKESKQIDFETETIKIFLTQLNNRAEHIETFKYGN